MLSLTSMHHSSGLLAADSDIGIFLEPSYRKDSRQRHRDGSTATPGSHLSVPKDLLSASASCPSLKHMHTSSACTPTPDVTAHDPEFKPFVTPSTTVSDRSPASTATRPRLTHLSSTYDAHSAPPSPGHLRSLRIANLPRVAVGGPGSESDEQPGPATASSQTSFEVDLSPPPMPHLPVPPTKEEREEARRQLTPSLHAALEANEKRVQRRPAHTHGQHQQSHSHRVGWLRRRAKSDPMSAVDEGPATATATTATAVPPPLPQASSRFVFNAGTTTESGTTASDDSGPGTPTEPSEREDDDVVIDSGYSEATHGFRKRVASISLKFDLALFRAKRRMKQRVGIES